MIHILIVDDHFLVRMGIRRLLDDVTGLKVVGEVGSGEEALRVVREKPPEVVLMDIKMPGIGGLEATRKIVRTCPSVKVLVLSAYEEEPFPSRLLQAGAVGYLTKDCGVEELVKAIRSVCSGQRHLSPGIAQQLALKHVSDTDLSPFEALSERELQVMIMITNGQKVQEISDKLHLSPKTVNSYRYRIFEKLQVHSDVELTHLAIRYGLLDHEVAGV